MASLVTMASIMAQAREVTDTVGSLNPPDSDLELIGNQSFKRLHDMLVSAYGADYNWEEYFFTTTQNSAVYPLPPDFYKMRLMDLQISPTVPAMYVPVQRYDEALRDSFNFGNQSAIQGGLIFRVSYNQTAPYLSQYANTFLSALEGSTGVLLTAAQPGLEGFDITLTAKSAGFQVITADVPDQTVTIQGFGGMTLQTLVNTINAAAGMSELLVASVVGPPGATMQAPTNIQNGFLGGTLEYDFVNGYERYVICDMAMQVCRRLERDFSPFLAEKAELTDTLQCLADERDPGFPLQAKDNQMEAIAMGPFSPFFNQRYLYTIQGNNLRLLRMGFM